MEQKSALCRTVVQTIVVGSSNDSKWNIFFTFFSLVAPGSGPVRRSRQLFLLLNISAEGSLLQGGQAVGQKRQEHVPSQKYNQINYYFFLNKGCGLDDLLVGMSSQPAQSTDRFITEEVTRHLFPGVDLVARYSIPLFDTHKKKLYNIFS